VGASVGAIRERLRFEDDLHYRLTQEAATAFFGYATASGWSYRAAVGAILDGELESDERPGSDDLGPGVTGSVAIARRWKLGDAGWFINGAAALSLGATSTHRAGAADDPRFVAADLNIGAMFGRTFAARWSPYLLARAFGGPVWWTVDDRDVTGGDTSHVQLGAGLSVALPGRLSAVVDVSALGEQALSLGLSRQL
jgi:hypothetical protein